MIYRLRKTVGKSLKGYTKFYVVVFYFQLFVSRDVLLSRSLEVYEAYRKEQANVG